MTATANGLQLSLQEILSYDLCPPWSYCYIIPIHALPWWPCNVLIMLRKLILWLTKSYAQHFRKEYPHYSNSETSPCDHAPALQGGQHCILFKIIPFDNVLRHLKSDFISQLSLPDRNWTGYCLHPTTMVMSFAVLWFTKIILQTELSHQVIT